MPNLFRNAAFLFAFLTLFVPAAHAQRTDITFVVRPDAALSGKLPKSGRLFVILSRRDSPEPRFGPGEAEEGAEPFFGKDIAKWDSKKPLSLGSEAVGFPQINVDDVPTGKWYAQALYDSDTTFSYINAPGNAFGPPTEIDIQPGVRQTFALALNQRIAPETVPADTDNVKYIRLQSRLLSKFWHRPMFLRAAVILPPGFSDTSAKRYPLRVNIGGYHTRYTDGAVLARRIPSDAPAMLTVLLDGEAPFGDSYSTNSANNGPYGDATVKELIPFIEKRFHAIGRPDARFTDGGSTGGWVALALQVYYPDFFNGAWSFYGDSVDFHRFQIIDIYSDANAFAKDGKEVPSARDLFGNTKFSVRREVQMENALGRSNSFVASGGQWGAWNAVYGPHDKRTKLPVPIWEPMTGKIDHKVAEKWRPYDLRYYLAKNWKVLGPKLQGKLHIWMGDSDNYFLNESMHLMDDFLKATQNPKSDAEITFGAGKGHGWEAIGQTQRMQQMVARVRP